MKDTQPPAQIQKASPGVQIKEIEKTKYTPPPLQNKETIQNEDIAVIRKEKYLSEVSEYKSVCNSELIERGKKTNKQKEKKKIFKVISM